jgi:hypothetical protein
MILAMARPIPPSNNKRRVLEKARIQKLKTWHENVKNIAKAEVEFISTIFRDKDDDAYTDWIIDETVRAEVVKEDP